MQKRGCLPPVFFILGLNSAAPFLSEIRAVCTSSARTDLRGAPLARAVPTATINFLDSHDGIGLLGARNILSPEDIDRMCERARHLGGLISYKTSEDGTNIPYGLNITWYSALNRKKDGDALSLQIKRFIASRAIALVLQGVPGIYLHSLFGTHNDHDAVEIARENRIINRSIVDLRSLMRSMKHAKSKKFRINRDLGKMLEARSRNRAFHPNGPQKILSLSPYVFAVMRTSPEGDRSVLALINATRSLHRVSILVQDIEVQADCWRDLLSEREFHTKKARLPVTLRGYDVLWLSPRVSVRSTTKAI